MPPPAARVYAALALGLTVGLVLGASFGLPLPDARGPVQSPQFPPPTSAAFAVAAPTAPPAGPNEPRPASLGPEFDLLPIPAASTEAFEPGFRELCAEGPQGQTASSLRTKQLQYWGKKHLQFKTFDTEASMAQHLRDAGICELPSRRVLDLGVNKGTKWLLELCPRGVDLTGVDANPASYAALVQGTDPLLFKPPPETSVHYIHSGVSNKAGTLTFYTNDRQSSDPARLGTGASGLVKFLDSSEVEVPVDTADSLVGQRGWFADSAGLALFKLDIESFEPLALLGAQRILAELKPPVVVMECSAAWNRASQQGALEPFSGGSTAHQQTYDLLDYHGYTTFAVGAQQQLAISGPWWDPKYGDKRYLHTRDCISFRRGTDLYARWLRGTYEGYGALRPAAALREEECAGLTG